MKKYPMTYEEFKKKCIENAKKSLGNDEIVNKYLAGEEAEMIIKSKYEEECNDYDGKGSYPENQKLAFNKASIATCGYVLSMCCDY